MRSLYTEDIEGTMSLMKVAGLSHQLSAKSITSRNTWTKSGEVPGILTKVHSMNGLFHCPKGKNLTTLVSPSEIQSNLSANILVCPSQCTTKV